MTYRLVTPSCHLFCDTLWSRSGTVANRLLCSVLSFSTAIPSRYYHNSNNLNIKKRMHWIVNIASWRLEGVSLINNFLFLFWNCWNWLWYKYLQRNQIKGGGSIGTYQSCQNKIGAYILLFQRFSAAIGEVLLGVVVAIGAATAWNRAIPCKKLKITHNYLFILFYYPF